ncbi:DUF551 domain-containing protein [Cronobacter sp. EKM101R]|uniref:DUF551 domain-containing protein n=1 Tax=unclassified Cronobacter TaxID=2649764 RepID=UPI0013EA418B|nr:MULTISPECIES: DUF551 domain-containing protein [unclassified Cronobacter]KAF6596661.1 DUF551 domain-containing protein [Cronobacter sp. EKM101R]KAF6599487.1 DUF551 domain-containing protein [Cronobacter sp. EKM102R]
MSEISEKRVEALASNILECHDVKPSEVKALAGLALLALRERAEPVAWMRSTSSTSFMSRFTTDENYASEQWGDEVVALYSLPPAQPVAVPVEFSVERLEEIVNVDARCNPEVRALARIALAVKQAQPVAVPEGIHPDTADLVTRFASALAEKLHKAEQKYGYSNGWMSPDWYNECLQSLWEHIEKGDPRDVAAYCAFMWHHGWVTTDYDRNVPEECRAAMLAAPAKPSSLREGINALRELGGIDAEKIIAERDALNECEIPEGWKLVPIEPTQEMCDAVLGRACFTFNGDGAKKIYEAMLAAAPGRQPLSLETLAGALRNAPLAPSDSQGRKRDSSAPVISGWIPCSERMPEIGNRVIVTIEGKYVRCASYTQWDGAKTERGRAPRFEDLRGIVYGVTHWMPLPAAPGKEG